MGLEDDVRAAIDERMKQAPFTLESQVNFPLSMPPEKFEVWNELSKLKLQLVTLAQQFDATVERF